MQNLHKVSFTLFLALALMIGACDDENKEGSSVNPAENIVGTWRLSSATAEVSGSGTEDLFAELEDCDKDDNLVINDDDTFEFNEGATKCNPNDLQVTSQGTYSINGNQLTFQETGSPSQVVQFSVTTSTLTIITTDSSLGVTATVTAVYTRQ